MFLNSHLLSEVEMIYDARILAEYREVLNRPKFGFAGADVEAIIAQIKAEGVLIVGQPLPERLPDPDDEPFLEAALAGEETFLVTGNKKHFPATARTKVVILSPGEFVSLYREMKTGGN